MTLRGPGRTPHRLGLGALGLLVLTAVAAQASEPYGRVRFADGNPSLFYPGTSDRVRAAPNLPVVAGTKVKTEKGRLEIDFGVGATLRLGPGTTAWVRRIPGKTGMKLDMRRGRAELEIWGEAGTSMIVKTDFGSISPETQGVLAVSGMSANAILDVRDGSAMVLSGSRGTLVTAPGRLILRRGTPQYAPPAAAPNRGRLRDDFTSWAATRREARQARHASPASLWESYHRELAEAGTFVRCPWTTVCWKPAEAGFTPLATGAWIRAGRAEVWVPSRPWGWATSHYGSWRRLAGSWIWVPDDSFGPGPRVELNRRPDRNPLTPFVDLPPRPEGEVAPPRETQAEGASSAQPPPTPPEPTGEEPLPED